MFLIFVVCAPPALQGLLSSVSSVRASVFSGASAAFAACNSVISFGRTCNALWAAFACAAFVPTPIRNDSPTCCPPAHESCSRTWRKYTALNLGSSPHHTTKRPTNLPTTHTDNKQQPTNNIQRPASSKVPAALPSTRMVICSCLTQAILCSAELTSQAPLSRASSILPLASIHCGQPLRRLQTRNLCWGHAASSIVPTTTMPTAAVLNVVDRSPLFCFSNIPRLKHLCGHGRDVLNHALRAEGCNRCHQLQGTMGAHLFPFTPATLYVLCSPRMVTWGNICHT